MLTREDCRRILRERQLHHKDIAEKYNIKLFQIEAFFYTDKKMSMENEEKIKKLFEKIKKEIPVKPCVCQICGKEFIRPKMKGCKPRTICSEECLKIFEKMQKEKFIRRHGGTTKRICDACGKEFYAFGYSTVFCSKECRKTGRQGMSKIVMAEPWIDIDHVNSVLSSLEGGLY